MRNRLEILASGAIGRMAATGLILASAACATPDGDAQGVSAAARGQAIAEASCSGCHATAAGAVTSPNAQAPSFEALADRPDMTRTALAVLLRTPHRTMPNLIIEPENVDDLSAYLSTLRK